MSTPDQTLSRVETWEPCAQCGEMTNWVHVRLAVPVCSEECEYQVATGRRPSAAPE